MSEDTISHLLRRAAEEERLASSCLNPAAGRSHRGLAAAYRARLEELAREGAALTVRAEKQSPAPERAPRSPIRRPERGSRS